MKVTTDDDGDRAFEKSQGLACLTPHSINLSQCLQISYPWVPPTISSLSCAVIALIFYGLHAFPNPILLCSRKLMQGSGLFCFYAVLGCPFSPSPIYVLQQRFHGYSVKTY